MSDLENFRLQKDLFFETDHHGPLTQVQKDNFEGLIYFPENKELILTLDLIEFDEKKKVDIQTSTGDSQEYQREGKILFEVNGEAAELTVFKSAHGYFIPFIDSQAGKITYGAGRYLDPPISDDGKLIIDFNLAYNPYCAYNENYSCPLPPSENRLSLAIEAGEKNFK